jgi:hypothetical protein
MSMKRCFPAVSLPAFDYRRATVAKRMIRRVFAVGSAPKKISSRIFPVRQGTGVQTNSG